MAFEIEEFSSYATLWENVLDVATLPPPAVTQAPLTPGTSPQTSAAFAAATTLIRVSSDVPCAVTVGALPFVVRRRQSGPPSGRLLPNRNPFVMTGHRPQYFKVAAGDTLTVLAVPPAPFAPF